MAPKNWKRLAPGPPESSVTVASQKALGQLPVPQLSDTFARLRSSLKPLARSQEELDSALKKVDEYEKSPLASALQERLVDRQKGTEHWLEEWWDNGAYMGYRDSVVVNVSYFYGFDAHPKHLPQTSVHRAAALTRAMLLFRQKYKLGQLKPEATKEGPICMDTYRWMFDCCRVPGTSGLDWAISYAKEGENGNAGHVVVFRKNRAWKVDIAKDAHILSTADLERQFQHIYDSTTESYPAIGVLTTNNRDVWAKDYSNLVSGAHNESIVRDIHSAAFVVCLDDTTPSDIVSFSKQLWHGGDHGKWLSNRWVDKPVQLIVCDGPEARSGIMGEHSIMDGTPTARMCDDILDALTDPSFDHGTSNASLPVPKPLDWNVSEKTHSAIASAEDAARELTDGQTLNHFLTSYGKGAVKSFGVSPDSWCQMMVQLAYRRLLAKHDELSARAADGFIAPGATYEAASTRKFLKGRTEAIRVVCEESEKWVRAMMSDSGKVEDEEKRALLRAAAKRHGQLAREAGNAQGVDRHLLGLKKLIKDSEEVPALYSDPLFLRSSHWNLSTSAIFSKHFEAYGWGEVVPDGFGVAYMTGFEDKFFFNITSRVEMPNAEFCEEIKRAASDMHDLFAPKSKL
ncbi:carnitine acetyl transferase [Schizopora paradoxa]|uniref:Carnitine acetyl transferase n=1 Tax=Schizopora paradoxa TaxID=27342 RepID=A0A0H2RRM6_9AGAM|nr:carnitine acetyl transferase [Schizopora paradoxa]